MDDYELRQRALELSSELTREHERNEDVVARAEVFYGFLTGRAADRQTQTQTKTQGSNQANSWGQAVNLGFHRANHEQLIGCTVCGRGLSRD